MGEDTARILSRLVRVGIVMSVDKEKRLARVKFENEDLPSGWLYVLQHYDADLHIEPDGEPHTHNIGSAGGHNHSGSSVTIVQDGDHTHNIENAGEHSHPGSKADDKDAEIKADGEHTHSMGSAGGHNHSGSSVNIVQDGEHTHKSSVGYVGNKPQQKHSHTRSYLEYWMPKIDAAVLCLCLPTDDGDGYVLGGM